MVVVQYLRYSCPALLLRWGPLELAVLPCRRWGWSPPPASYFAPVDSARWASACHAPTNSPFFCDGLATWPNLLDCQGRREAHLDELVWAASFHFREETWAGLRAAGCHLSPEKHLLAASNTWNQALKIRAKIIKPPKVWERKINYDLPNCVMISIAHQSTLSMQN